MKRHDVLDSIVIAIIATGASYALGLGFGWIDTVNWLEAFAVFTSYSCTWLCVRQRRINYPIGAVSTAAYCVLFWQAGLLASMALNAYLTPALLYGWIRWRRDSDTRPVGRVALKWAPVYLIATGLAYLGILWIVGSLGATLAFTDSFILVGSILAQFLLDNKKIENWWVWAIVDGVAIYTYFSAGLFVAGVQYVVFFANCFVGLAAWNRSKNARQNVVLGQNLQKPGALANARKGPVLPDQSVGLAG
jgi:nicotinamide mononucleotide transporter